MFTWEIKAIARIHSAALVAPFRTSGRRVRGDMRKAPIKRRPTTSNGPTLLRIEVMNLAWVRKAEKMRTTRPIRYPWGKASRINAWVGGLR